MAGDDTSAGPFHPSPEGVLVEIRAQPGAKRNAVLGVRDSALRVSVTQAPERGKANEAITEVLAEFLGVRRSRVSLVSGETHPRKRFLVKEANVDDLLRRLADAFGGEAAGNGV